MKIGGFIPWLMFFIIFSGRTNADNSVVNPTQPPCPNSPILPSYNQPFLASTPPTNTPTLTPFWPTISPPYSTNCIYFSSCQNWPPTSPCLSCPPASASCYPTACYYTFSNACCFCSTPTSISSFPTGEKPQCPPMSIPYPIPGEKPQCPSTLMPYPTTITTQKTIPESLPTLPPGEKLQYPPTSIPYTTPIPEPLPTFPPGEKTQSPPTSIPYPTPITSPKTIPEALPTFPPGEETQSPSTSITYPTPNTTPKTIPEPLPTFPPGEKLQYPPTSIPYPTPITTPKTILEPLPTFPPGEKTQSPSTSITYPTPITTPKAIPELLPTFPPGEKTQCPPGTLGINGICRLVYCGTQSIYREGKCLRVECPEGSYWTGSRCQIEEMEPVLQTIAFNSTLTTHVNSISSPVTINNVNNLTLSSATSIDVSRFNTTLCEDCEFDLKETTFELKCCIVVTPRICKPKIDGDRKRWYCYSKRYRRCGDICIAPTILLKPPYPSGNENVSVLPPDNYLEECRQSQACADSENLYDCSGCVIGRPENCSRYCYRYICPTHRCRFINQRDFCIQYPGEQGCSEDDGCFDNWCGSY